MTRTDNLNDADFAETAAKRLIELIESNRFFFSTRSTNKLVEIRELDNNINDVDFAETAAERLIELIEGN